MLKKSVPEVLITAKGHCLGIYFVYRKKFCKGILKDIGVPECKLNIF